jgi:hypothetical protein
MDSNEVQLLERLLPRTLRLLMLAHAGASGQNP